MHAFEDAPTPGAATAHVDRGQMRVGSPRSARSTRGTVRAVAFVGAFVAVSLAGCSSGGGEQEDPVVTVPSTLGRIDGPATVDPSYDPFAVTPTTAGG